MLEWQVTGTAALSYINYDLSHSVSHPNGYLRIILLCMHALRSVCTYRLRCTVWHTLWACDTGPIHSSPLCAYCKSKAHHFSGSLWEGWLVGSPSLTVSLSQQSIWHAVFRHGPKLFSWNWSQLHTSPLTEKWDGPTSNYTFWAMSCPGKADIKDLNGQNLCFGWKLTHNH